MKQIISLIPLCLLLLSCGGQTAPDNAPDTTFLYKINTEGVIETATAMKRDITERLKDDDIQAVAALCQEALDNIAYFNETGEHAIARVYKNEMRSFVKNNTEGLDDMASQNYIVKQFVIAVCKDDTPEPSNDKQQTESKKATTATSKPKTRKQAK